MRQKFIGLRGGLNSESTLNLFLLSLGTVSYVKKIIIKKNPKPTCSAFCDLGSVSLGERYLTTLFDKLCSKSVILPFTIFSFCSILKSMLLFLLIDFWAGSNSTASGDEMPCQELLL